MEIQRANATIIMKLIITDTNVFFDLISMGALPEFFALDFDICTVDFVINEILLSDQKTQVESFIRAKQLTVFKISADEIEEIIKFKTNRVFKGITDKTVLWKSHTLQCPILTGDNKLRNEAKDLKIEVHGILWVINKLVENGIITNTKGVELLESLRLINYSLPGEEINKIIKRLS